MKDQKVLVSMAGPHGTDIVGAVLECLANHPCDINDCMLSRLYHHVTFGVLITLRTESDAIFKDLAEAAAKWDATLTYDVPDTQAAEPPNVQAAQKQAHRIGPKGDINIPPSLEEAPYSNRIKYAASILNQNGLNKGGNVLSCADFRLSVPRTVDMNQLRTDLFELSASHEVIDEIARHAGVVDQVAGITEAAMNGEIDFKESLRRRVALLKDTNVDVLEKVKESLTFTEGAHFLCQSLKKLGFKLAVISGGFIPLARYVKAELGLDYAFANQLQVSVDGKTFTGETVGPVVDGVRKAELLDVIAQAEGVTPKQVIAVGDGANDLWMLNKAGLGIAFNAKPRVQEQAPSRINQKSLIYVLTLLGFSDQDLEQLSQDY
ncbi:HAD-like domain-containing protein [Circinella umbellata]|nr:HAD-like domain-containing protein [Circinella umbellata]